MSIGSDLLHAVNAGGWDNWQTENQLKEEHRDAMEPKKTATTAARVRLIEETLTYWKCSKFVADALGLNYNTTWKDLESLFAVQKVEKMRIKGVCYYKGLNTKV